MLEPGRAVFIEGKYTDRGKWMDGWESRRKRTPGHDHSIIELGGAGTLLGFDIDTHAFLGQSAVVRLGRRPQRSALDAARGLAGRDLDRALATEPAAPRLAEPLRGRRWRSRHAPAPQHLSGRRRGALPRLRAGRAQLDGARRRRPRTEARGRRLDRPRGIEERSGVPGLLRRPLRAHEQPAATGPLCRHGRRLGERGAVAGRATTGCS